MEDELTVWRFLRGLRANIQAVTRGPVEGERKVVSTLAGRIEELLSGENFTVSTDGVTVAVRSNVEVGTKMSILMPTFIWQSELPLTQRLTLVFESVGPRLQEFLTAAYGRPWPAAGAAAHVVVTDDRVEMWWDGDSKEEAVAELRPITRAELGI